MKAKITAVLAVLTLTFSLNAEVLIFNQSYTETVIGHGGKVPYRFTGNFLVDDDDNIYQLDVNAKAKTFQVWDYTLYDWQARYLRSSLTGKTLSLIIPMGEVGGMALAGTSGLIFTGMTNFNTPKVLTMSGTVMRGDDPDAEALQFKGSLTLNIKSTIAANQAGSSIDTVLGSLKAALLAKGYVELN